MPPTVFPAKEPTTCPSTFGKPSLNNSLYPPCLAADPARSYTLTLQDSIHQLLACADKSQLGLEKPRIIPDLHVC
ncbi:unnamed protein product [Tuber melanosporum]|uniref:(Perigord truffle) hypothetical protein n=1 Tax=Tuber melanosporum (strain Mel28) TaxID=656061 RepID=D5GES3_TUBMM|nr:uncharacterized protein GSTUM_00006582001 [Tuber melanosporum]CAZ83016.1 unnamed protein product [Tuber melanosporum]